MIHQRKHTGVKSFKCKKCGISFPDKGNLTQHEKFHSEQRPYTCEICGKSFSRKSHVLRHLNMVHDK